jgi:hypothetical protein
MPRISMVLALEGEHHCMIPRVCQCVFLLPLEIGPNIIEYHRTLRRCLVFGLRCRFLYFEPRWEPAFWP